MTVEFTEVWTLFLCPHTWQFACFVFDISTKHSSVKSIAPTLLNLSWMCWNFRLGVYLQACLALVSLNSMFLSASLPMSYQAFCSAAVYYYFCWLWSATPNPLMHKLAAVYNPGSILVGGAGKRQQKPRAQSMTSHLPHSIIAKEQVIKWTEGYPAVRWCPLSIRGKLLPLSSTAEND